MSRFIRLKKKEIRASLNQLNQLLLQTQDDEIDITTSKAAVQQVHQLSVALNQIIGALYISKETDNSTGVA